MTPPAGPPRSPGAADDSTPPTGGGTAPDAPGGQDHYPAVWTRRVLVAMASVGVIVLVVAVVWFRGHPQHGSTRTSSNGPVATAQLGPSVTGSTGTSPGSTPAATTGSGTSSSTTTDPSSVSSAPATTVSPPASSTSAPTTSPPVTAHPATFYDRGSVGPCPGTGATGTTQSPPGSDGGDDLDAASGVARCLVHAWAWKQVETTSRYLGMDELAKPSVIHALLNLGNFLNHLTPAASGCRTITGAIVCTYTDGITDVALHLVPSASPERWIASAVSWGPAGSPPTTTTTVPTTTASTTVPPAPPAAPAGS